MESHQLSSQAQALLSDMAKDHGLASLAPNDNGIIPIELDGSLTIALAFDGVNNKCFMLHVLRPGGHHAFDRPWEALCFTDELKGERTRVAIDPETKALVVTSDIHLAGLEYWRFAESLAVFVEDVETAIEAFGVSETPGQEKGSSLTAEDYQDMLVIRV